MTARLVITVGLPACGKTTRARAWVAEAPCDRVRVNRDDVRAMLHGGWLGTAEAEAAVTVAVRATVRALLREGWDVICDDTHLRDEYVQAQRDIALRAGALFEVWDMTDVPVQVCVARDAARTVGHVGAEVIERMHRRLQADTAKPAR